MLVKKEKGFNYNSKNMEIYLMFNTVELRCVPLTVVP